MKKMTSALFATVVAMTLCGGAQAALLATFSGVDRNTAADPDVDIPVFTSSFAATAETAFFVKLSNGIGTENFESQTPGPVANSGLSLNFNGLSATLNGGSPEIIKVNVPGADGSGSQYSGPTDGSGRYSVGAGTNKALIADAGTGNFTIRFNQAVAAFGFNCIDVGDFGGLLTVQLLDQNGNALDGAVASVNNSTGPTASGALLYFGLVSDVDFWGVNFLMTGSDGADTFGFDNFTMANRRQLSDVPGGDVPEPTSMLLALAALAATAAARRSRR